MEFDARLKAITRLAESATEAAGRALKKEIDGAASTLVTATKYDHLEQSLAILGAIGFRFSANAVQVLVQFVESVGQRQLAYSEQDRLFGDRVLSYRNAATLIVRATQALVQLRYLETAKVLHALMRLSLHSTESIRRKATDGLKELAEYDISVFYGNAEHGGVGPTPQKQVVDELQKLTDAEITIYFWVILVSLDGVLSPTMEGASWSYKALTLSHSATPAIPSVSEVRAQAIALLVRVYGVVAETDRKLAVVRSLTGATRTETRVARRDEANSMFIRDTKEVLAFFEKLVEADELEVVQKIEHNTYWIFVHAISEEICEAAFRVREKISERAEYKFYRILIGFEGIFGDWEKLKEGEREWNETDELRRSTARRYAEHIDERNYAEWRNRILKYAQTKSDDLATFPIFYYFLEYFSAARPELAFRLLSEDDEAIKSFLIPLLRGLWSGTHREQLRGLMESWMKDGRNLYPAMKLFLTNADLDLVLIGKLLSRADEVDDLFTIREAVSVAISNYDDGRRTLVGELMLPAIGLLTQRSNCSWVFDNWFRREVKGVLAVLEPHAVDTVLQNLTHLQKLDYHAEELLYIIALRFPDKVVEYLCGRLDFESRATAKKDNAFEAVPYELHKLNEPLSRVPVLAVRKLRERYHGDYSRLIYGGARLLSNIFPKFSGEFEAELLKLIQIGGQEDYEFVLAVLRNYRGELFIHGVCKEIVRAIPADSRLWTEVAIALETTGVVSGEFGMAVAYEQKRQEVIGWLDDSDSRVQHFAKWYIEDLERMRDAERKRAEEDVALQKFRYGET